ncbi:agmatinase [Candidatus Woesearchaeota archaeon]|nr:agmatinase [Candidatus Woesearchaeota archaeon]
MQPYFGLMPEYTDPDKSKYVILPVPFEGTVSGKPGTAKGPQAIQIASQDIELFDEETRTEPFAAGIATLPPMECTTAIENAEKLHMKFSEILAKKQVPIMIGGEHSLTVGAVQACKETYPDLKVVQIDAHLDLREEFEGNRYSHATPMKRISDMKVPLLQIGIRSYSWEEDQMLQTGQIETCIVTGKEIVEGTEWLRKVKENLGTHSYLTIDVDGLDPSIMPSTGTPEPGGLTWYQTLALLRLIFSKTSVVGMDITEFAPIPGMHAPDILIARLLYKLIAYHSSPTIKP